jgi:hypothetical protein
LHDNTPAHRELATLKKLAYLGFQFLDYPPSSDYHLLPELKSIESHFASDTEVIAAAETWLDGQPSEFYLSGLHKLYVYTSLFFCFFFCYGTLLSAYSELGFCGCCNNTRTQLVLCTW